MGIELSAAFATSMDTPAHVEVAEQLGYGHAWLYDSPALYPDVWMMLGEAARRTSRIGLGPGVLVPSLRHPMTNAAAIATLEALAPGRVAIAIGSGFTGRLTLGQKPLKWAFVREYTQVLLALLAGETVTWEGARMRMSHPDGFGAARPIDVALLMGTGGPKGEDVARELADGVFATAPTGGFGRCAVLTFGTVLDDGEDPGSARSLAAAGHAGALVAHGMHARGIDVTPLPGGAAWLAALEQFPADEQHIALHEGHLITANERDQLILTGELLARFGYARDAGAWRDHVQALEAGGATEVAYQPAGPDIPGELERFAAAVHDAL